MVPDMCDSIVIYVNRKLNGRISITITATEKGITQKAQFSVDSQTSIDDVLADAAELGRRLADQVIKLVPDSEF